MDIIKLGDEVAEYAVDYDGGKITVIGLEVDCRAEEDDSEKIITISMGEHGPVMGPGGKGGYIADIIIPPRRYENEEYITDENEIGLRGVAIPLDMERVTLRLWPNYKEV